MNPWLLPFMQSMCCQPQFNQPPSTQQYNVKADPFNTAVPQQTWGPFSDRQMAERIVFALAVGGQFKNAVIIPVGA